MYCDLTNKYCFGQASIHNERRPSVLASSVAWDCLQLDRVLESQYIKVYSQRQLEVILQMIDVQAL